MLGEVVVHGEDIRRPLGLHAKMATDAVVGCLEMYKGANFPVGSEEAHRRTEAVGNRRRRGPMVRAPR